MSEQEGVRLIIDLDTGRESEPIEGRLEDHRGVMTDFCGWLQLAAAIEALRRSAPASGAPTTASEQGTP